MNIHFKDKELFEKFKEAALVRITVGSTMYGIDHKDSDIDYLYILPTSDNELRSFQKSYHQLQYHEKGIDHNFTSLHNFIWNAVNGDSTINFECIHSNALKGSMLEFLYEVKDIFSNYKIVRSYLGLARRDGKHYYKDTSNDAQKKKLIHIMRGYYFARNIMSNIFNVKDSEVIDNARVLRTIDSLTERKKFLKLYLDSVSGLRDLLNERLDNKNLGLAQFMSVDHQRSLDECLIMLFKSNRYIDKQMILGDVDLSPFYEANENWVQYK